MKIGYARTSREEQDIQSQIDMLIKAGVPANDIFIEAGIGGATNPVERPQYQRMLGVIERSRRPNMKGEVLDPVTELYVSEYSRVGRDSTTMFNELTKLCAMGIIIVPLTGPNFHFETLPPGLDRVILSIAAYVSQLERELLKERTKYGMKNARKKGKQIGRPTVEIDFKKVKENMEKYRLKEAQAVRVAGYSLPTYYKKKKELENKGESI